MSDDWREETQLRLQKSVIYQALQVNQASGPVTPHLLSLIDNAAFYAYQRSKMVLRHMGEFTLHDGEHQFRVLRLMERLLPPETILKLTIPERMLLILSALLHDIGMAPDEKDVLAWKKIWDSTVTFADSNEEIEYDNFKRYCAAREDDLWRINVFIKAGNFSMADLLKNYLVSDYIRSTHSARARQIIQQDWDGKIIFRDTDLTSDFAEICFSHTEDAISLLELDVNYLCGPDTYACLPLVAIVLRLADILDFDAKRTPAVLFSHLSVKHPVSISEWNKHRAIEAWEISDSRISFQAKCTHPAIEATIHSFCDLIDTDLGACNNVIARLNEHFKANNRDIQMRLPLKVDRSRIQTKRNVYGNPLYTYHLTQFNLSKTQVIDLLMGTKLYSNPEVALRELIQNSIDACLLRKAMEAKWKNPYAPEIFVRYYSENGEGILEVSDNGTGMDQDIIDNYYSKIGSSFYKSADFYRIRQESGADFIPTSRFGIGILSCFMVADTLIVDTRRVYGPHESSDPINLIVEGQDSIFWIKKGVRAVPGTTTRLILRKKRHPWENMTEDQFIKSVENVIPNPPFSISIKTETHDSVRDENSFSKMTASSLLDYSWQDHENIRKIEITLGGVRDGIVGSAIVGILESHNEPVDKIELKSKKVKIDNEIYSLEKKAYVGDNEINLSSTTITIDDDGNISEESSQRSLAKSASKISLHGIEIPTTLFPESWRKQQNQASIIWPFPLLLVIDICGKRDIDLNSPRTQILVSDNWLKFEEDLAYVVCLKLRDLLPTDYWVKLKRLLLSKSSHPYFTEGLKLIES